MQVSLESVLFGQDFLEHSRFGETESGFTLTLRDSLGNPTNVPVERSSTSEIQP